MSTASDVLLLAEILEEDYDQGQMHIPTGKKADAELRRLHEVEQQRDLFAKWIFMHGNHSGDWACAQCHPYSDMLAPGFVCAFHQAEVIAKRPPTDLADAPKSNGEFTCEMIDAYWPQPAVHRLPADDTEGGAV